MSISDRSRSPGRAVLGALLCLLPLAAPAAGERERFLDAYHAFQKEDYARGRTLSAGLEGYVLYPYLEYAMLDHELERTPAEKVRAFMSGRRLGPRRAVARRLADAAGPPAGARRFPARLPAAKGPGAALPLPGRAAGLRMAGGVARRSAVAVG